METESSVVVIEAPSTAEYHHCDSPNSGLGEQLSVHVPYEMDESDSWKDRLHLMTSRLQDRATGFKACLQLKQKKKLLSCLEVILLSSVILIIWMIFTTPTIVFVLSSATVTNEVILHSGNWVSSALTFYDLWCMHGPGYPILAIIIIDTFHFRYLSVESRMPHWILQHHYALREWNTREKYALKSLLSGSCVSSAHKTLVRSTSQHSVTSKKLRPLQVSC